VSSLGGCKETQDYCNDVHIFDIQKSTWMSPEIRGDLPAARYLHSAAVYDNKMFVYGGFAKNPDCKMSFQYLLHSPMFAIC
jgi:N-acetylneuraminic acid mutarotase